MLKRTKIDLTIILTIIGLIIGFCAWRFPVQTEKKPSPPIETQRKEITISESVKQQDEKPQLLSNDTTSTHYHSISIESVIGTLKDKKLTDLQIDQFIKRINGSTVIWEVSVKDVTKKSYYPGIFLACIPNYQADEFFPEILIAIFPRSAEADLSALSPGDVATIQGTLDFSGNFDNTDFSLEDCTLVNYLKK